MKKKVIKSISHCCLCDKCCKFLNLRWGQTMTHLTWAVTTSWHPASSSLLFVTVASKRSYWQDHEPLEKSWRENHVFLKKNSSTGGSMFSKRSGLRVCSPAFKSLKENCGLLTFNCTYLIFWNILLSSLIKYLNRDFSGIPVIMTPCFQCRGHEFNPWSWNQGPTCHNAWPKNKKT